MKIYQTLQDIPESDAGTVLAIGNFDGVHKGHQILIGQAKEIAEKAGKKLAVLTFEPHPRRLFRPDEPPGRITPPALKHRRLEACGVDTVFSLTFNWDFASQSAESFVENVLKQGIKPAHVVTGYDFCFGQLRKGTPQTIKDSGLEVTTVSQINDDNAEKLSSSRIRQKLRAGLIDEANELLGWDWEIEGEIFKGDRRGHELGYPTANVLLGETLHPAYGVYAARVQIEGEDEWRPSATNIGIRPMFELKEGQVEAHILDFEDRDIYGRNLRIKPVQRLRGEAKFDNLDDLTAQMEKDCAQAQEILS